VLSNLRFRTKLTLIVAIPILAALIVTVPGLRTRLRDLDASNQAQAQAKPAQQVRTFLSRIDDEGSLSAWWVASADPAVRSRLTAARVATDRAAAPLARAEQEAQAAGATNAARGIHDLRESVALLGQQRQFVDLRFTPDSSVLGYFRDVGRTTTNVLDGFVSAPQGAAAAIMFRDEATLARLESALADERSVLAVAFTRATLPDSLVSDLVAAVTTQNAALNELQSQGRPSTRAAVQTGMETFRSATDQVRQRRAPALESHVLAANVTPANWYGIATVQLAGWRQLGTQITAGINRDLARRHDDAQSSLVAVGVGSVAVLLIAAGLAFVIARATTRPLRQLADNAHDVATRQLPALVDALYDPRAEPPTVSPIVVKSRDELGALAKAFNDVERTTVRVADLQRETVRTGIADLYVNLARRNQPLLTRQLSLVDQLEREERDPDRLSALFTLDHLATRMRRNSDSLLVLAGVDEKAAARAPVPLLEVIRGAVSETTDFPRIDTAGIPRDIEIVGYASTDLAHLLSELLENATSFSTPASRVVVMARAVDSGVELTISDQGIGIPPERMQELNELLADPPPPGLVMSRSLGLVVVARLAHRIGCRVRLQSAPEVGTAAIVSVPSTRVRDRREADVDLVAHEAADVSVGASAPTTDVDLSDAPAPILDPVAVPAVVDTAVPTGDVPIDPAAATTDAGLPRRHPGEAPVVDLSATVTPPPSRSPDAVFELVARYEAGRRRAESQTSEPPEERP
jgi:signal transduction histidine kinase